tara:strand:+ start:1231 stop:1542 length:312 start_codon:yes stop_codon:yes gene_type:complete
MVKSELVQALCHMHPNIFRKDMEKISNTIFIEIIEALCSNKNVEIRGFGTYKVTLKKARTGRNPKNSESVQIPSKKAVKWKMSKLLFKRLNKNFTENQISATN